MEGTDPKSVIYLNKSFCSWMTHGGDDVVKSLGICTLLNLAQLFLVRLPKYAFNMEEIFFDLVISQQTILSL